MIKLRSAPIIFLLIGFLIVAACTKQQGPNPQITQAELYSHIDFLASDSLMGRKPGTPYDRVAAKYIKDELERSGFNLMEKNGYQFFDFIDHQGYGENNFLRVNGKSFKFGSDFITLPFSSNDTLASTVVFIGYGLSVTTPELVWDDYLPVNVSGKWVMLLKGNPLNDNEDNPFSQITSDRYKAMLAMDNGAVGVVFVSGYNLDSKDKLVQSKQKAFSIGIPVLHVNRTVANSILEATGKNIRTLEKKLVEIQKPLSFAVGINLCARTHIITKKKSTQNVIGFIEGADPYLKNQYVIIGAHYDHIGMGGINSSSRDPDSIAVHNGADDNASGVAALLEIGQKLAHFQPKRSIVAVAFGAEEMGLLGSRFFTENPLIPLDSVTTMVNIDMLGRLNEDLSLQVGGVKTSIEAEEVLLNSNENFGFNLSLSPQGYGPSDHASFYSKGIPVLFFSTGPHIDYHTPNDVIDNINFEGLELASNYIFDVVNSIANSPHKFNFQESDPASPISRHGQELKVRLGIMPDVSGAISDGLKIIAVTENQPASLSGIKGGDIITAIDGKPVNNIHDYMFRLQDITVGSTISLEFKRNGEIIVVLVQF